MRKIKNRKIDKKKVIGLTALLLTGGLLTSCAVDRKEYEYTRIECSSDGEYHESRQFKPYDPNSNSNLPNSFIYYGKWEQTDDGKYSRTVSEYNANKVTYSDMSNIRTDLEANIEKTLGEPTKSYEQIADYVSDEELSREAHYEATFYDINRDRTITIRETDKGKFIALAAGMGAAVIAMGALIAWRKKQDAEGNTQNKEQKLVLKKEEK